MPKLSDIYGTDDNDFAMSIASDALTNTAGKENVWSGGPIDQSARSRGADGEPNPDAVITHNKPDSRAVTKGNHGSQG